MAGDSAPRITSVPEKNFGTDGTVQPMPGTNPQIDTDGSGPINITVGSNPEPTD